MVRRVEEVSGGAAGNEVGLLTCYCARLAIAWESSVSQGSLDVPSVGPLARGEKLCGAISRAGSDELSLLLVWGSYLPGERTALQPPPQPGLWSAAFSPHLLPRTAEGGQIQCSFFV